MSEKSFKTFLKEEENKHPYLSSIEDELGINPADLEKEPQVASFFSFNKNINNIGTYKVVDFKRNSQGEITHAVVKQINDKNIKNRQYQNIDGEIKRTEKDSKDKTFIVPIKDLDGLMSQDFTQTPSQGAMA